MNYDYRLNCGQYVLHLDGKPVGKVLDDIALAIDAENGILRKHGEVAMVEAWAKKEREKLRPYFPQLADSLVVLSGRLPLAEVNKCLKNSGFGEKLLADAKSGRLVPEPWTN